MSQYSVSRNKHYHRGNSDIHEVVMVADEFGYIKGQANATSKGRLKVSPYETVFFNTFQYGIETDVWDTEVTGTASATWDSATSQVILSIGGTSGDKIVRQTRTTQRYIPGRTSTVSYALLLGTPVEGIRKRVGMFDQFTDGFWFEDSGVWVDGVPNYNCAVSNGNTPISVPRSQWNGDKLDGTGPSGIVADPTKIQLISIEYEWYGAGAVKFGWVIDGNTHVVHTHHNANHYALPWAKTPFLPIRLEMEALSTVAEGPFLMTQGSNSLISEGSVGKIGIGENISAPFYGTRMAAALTNAGTSDNWYPILSIRLKAADLKGIVLPASFQVATVDNTNVFYKLCRNATLTNGGANSWTPLSDENSFVEYQTYTAPTAVAQANHGVTIASGFAIGGGGGANVILDEETVYQLGRTDMGATSDTLTIMCASSNTGKDAMASMTWIEQR